MSRPSLVALDPIGNEPLETARQTIAIEIEGLNALAASIDAAFAHVVELIDVCRGRVVVTGVGKSGHVGQKIAATLASTGTPAFFLHAAEAAHGDLGMIGETDIVLAISNSGESAEMQPIVEYCRRFQVRLIAMTAKPDSSLGRYADAVLRLPEAAEACPISLAPMTSTTMSLVLGDALASALMRVRNFQRDDFAKFHPGGKLGAQLLKLHEVLDRMPHLKAMPRVETTSPMTEVIAVISRGQCGATAVYESGRFAGIVTDGDLRRALEARPTLDQSAADMMTASPLAIGADRLAVDALALCEERRVSAIFVTDADGGICGLVQLKDLLALGIV
ncbi:KpsF/GutQ family sugar-phosphate isomerase [Aureimonas leprariae]|uniref:KpsF/GutQ family sugar-phosphate isomerase n=1 Tax=Plantimonas leprariae TaxID=2615207 RepID=A0A7V7PQK2_9HYPH|nr:KpsF/GutQ family sugar-phosphate isomerase [Aureimonas leprariae]KAB0680650.1 KpsF/GutQ family sugar-phosphate isomerase [Aureimonas leprariae]